MNSQPQIAWLLQQIPCCQHGLLGWSCHFNNSIGPFLSLTHLTTCLIPCSLGHQLAFPQTWLWCGLSNTLYIVSMLPTHLFFFGASMFPAPQINLYVLAISTQIQYFMPILQSFATHFINWRQNGKQRRDWFGASFELLICLRKINFIVCPRHLQFGFWGWWNIWLHLMFFITFLIKRNQSLLIHWIYPQRNPFHCYQNLSLQFPETLRGRQSQQC